MSTSTTARIHLNTGKVPSRPGGGWTRFVCISDTHSRRFAVPAGDVLIHAGDLTQYGDLRGTIDWLKALPHPTKIIIAGNHDIFLDEQMSESGYVRTKDINRTRSLLLCKEARDAGIHYIEHESFQFTTASGRQWKVYGSPATRRHSSGCFQYSTNAEASAIYGRIPSDTEILITHTPPHMTLDVTKRGQHVGCQVLAARLKQLDACRLHVFGHIHEAHGACIVKDSDDANGRVAVNAAMISGKPAVIVDLAN